MVERSDTTGTSTTQEHSPRRGARRGINDGLDLSQLYYDIIFATRHHRYRTFIDELTSLLDEGRVTQVPQYPRSEEASGTLRGPLILLFDRWYRCAQPLANFWHLSGMAKHKYKESMGLEKSAQENLHLEGGRGDQRRHEIRYTGIDNANPEVTATNLWGPLEALPTLLAELV